MENRADRVWEIFRDCLFRDEELNGNETPDDAVLGEGIMRTFGFHPGRLKEHDAEIAEVLTGLPKEFYADGGGGWSFLNLCVDAEGHHWGEHVNVEQLCALAFATKRGMFLVPRELWSSMPGGMPYVMFDLKGGLNNRFEKEKR